MSRAPLAALLICAVALVACHAQVGTGAAGDEEGIRVGRADQVRLVFLGDSHLALGKWADGMADALKPRHERIESVVHAVPGWGPQDILAAMDEGGLAVSSPAGKVNIAVLMTGSSTKSVEPLAALVAALRAKGFYVVVCTTPPRRDTGRGPDSLPRRSAAYNAALRATYPPPTPGLLRETQCVDVVAPFLEPGVRVEEGEWMAPAYDSGDGIHLTKEGYALLAERFRDALWGMLQRR